MDYRFEISLPNSTEFRCEIAINGDQTFQQLHDKIVETFGYDGSQMASFFTLDKMGNRVKEIALMEMSTDDDDDNNTLVMDVTMIREVVNASCIELEYVYDFFANKYFRVEYAGEYIGDSADVLPLCVYCEGEIPPQSDFDVNEEWGWKSWTTNTTIALWMSLEIAATVRMTIIVLTTMNSEVTMKGEVAKVMTTGMRAWMII